MLSGRSRRPVLICLTIAVVTLSILIGIAIVSVSDAGWFDSVPNGRAISRQVDKRSIAGKSSRSSGSSVAALDL